MGGGALPTAPGGRHVCHAAASRFPPLSSSPHPPPASPVHLLSNCTHLHTYAERRRHISPPSVAVPICMDACAGSSPPHSQENPPERGGDLGEAPAEEIGGEAADDFLFAEDTFPSLPDFPCLSSPSSSTFSSSSSSNSSCAYTNAAGGAGGGGADGAAGDRSVPASAGEGFDALDDIDQLLDFASLSMPWDSEPTFPEVSMMLEDAMFAPPHPVGEGRREGKAVLEGTGGEETCMDAGAAGEDLPRFFMEWLTSNRENISAEDLRSIRLRRSTIEAAAARLGGGRQGTMQLLKLILTWVQNHHLQRKRPRDGLEEAAGLHGHGHSQLSSPGGNPGYEFPAGVQDMTAGGGTSWMPYQQPFTPPACGGDAVYQSAAGQYPFHQSSSTSSVVVNSQPFSPPAVGDMHAAGGGNMAWTQPYVPYPGASMGSYPLPPVVPQPFSPGFGGQYAGAGHPMPPQRIMVAVEASATKEARKKRMARQRRLSCLQQQRSQQLNLGQIQVPVLPQEPSAHQSTHSVPVTPSAGGWGFWSPGSPQQVQNARSKSNSSRAPMQQVPRSPEAAAAPPPAKPAPGARQEESPQPSTASEKRQVHACRA